MPDPIVPSSALRARRAALALGAVLVVAAWLLAACGSDAGDVSATPGFDAGATTLDTTTFTLAESQGGASTTLPPGFFDPDDPFLTTTTEVAPTTTNPPLFLPGSTEITSLCGMARSIDSLFPADPLPASEVGPLLDRMLPNLDRYVEVAPGGVKEDVIVFRNVVNRLATLFREGGGSLEYPPLAQEVQQLITEEGVYAGIGDRLERIRAVGDTAC